MIDETAIFQQSEHFDPCLASGTGSDDGGVSWFVVIADISIELLKFSACLWTSESDC
jgi:hypothetical protein